MRHDKIECMDLKLTRSAAVRRWGAVLLLFSLSILPYVNSLNGSFHFDDESQIIRNEHIRTAAGLADARPLSRWLTFASFYLNYKVGGLSGMPAWHLGNILLHAACVLALYGVLKTMAGCDGSIPRHAPLIGAALLAVHPLASEPVNYIQARSVLLYTFFTLSAVWASITATNAHRSLSLRIAAAIATLAFIALAAFSKEVGIFYATIVPILFLLTRVNRRLLANRRFWISATIGLATILAATAIWIRSAGLWQGIADRLFGVPGRPDGYWQHFWAQTVIFWRYVALAICPLPSSLSVDHAVPYFQPPFADGRLVPGCRVYGPADLDVLMSILGLLMLFILALVFAWRLQKTVAALLTLVPIGVLPYFFMPSFEMMVEYRFYLSLAAFCALCGMLLATLVRLSRDLGIASVTVILILMAGLTLYRNRTWRTDLSLWSDAAEKAPRKARTINALAAALLDDTDARDPRRALELAERSLDKDKVDLWPGYNPYIINTLAEAYLANGQYARAEWIERELIRRRLGDQRVFEEQLEKIKAAEGHPQRFKQRQKQRE